MTYKVKQEDLIGDIAGFPIEVVQKMVDEQVRQGNPADVKVFQHFKAACENGFNWGRADDSYAFWYDVIQFEKFDIFFQKYPKHEVAAEPDPMSLIPELQGVEMEVSDDEISWYTKLVLFKYKGKYHTEHSYYNHCRPIKKPVKLTRQEIAYRLGIDTNFIIEE